MKTIFSLIVLFVISGSMLAQTTDTSLVAYYPFNGNTIDVSGNGHDGTLNGNATLVPDRFNTQNSAYTFPDQTSNISLANTININLETGFTLNSWVKYKNTYSVIIGKHVCGYVNGLVLGIDYDGQFQLWLGNSGWQTVRTSETLVEERWYMLTATYDGISGAAKIYIDGQLENSANINYTNFSPYPISIGEVFQNNCSAANMSGAVDEVKIFNRVLSDAEILEEYNNTYTDLVLFLPFNGNANDESGNNNNGTVSGASLTQDRFGTDGRAYSFDGVDDFITIADNPNLFSDSLTISWWYNISQYDDAGAVIGWIEGGSRYQQFFNGTSFSYFNAYRSDPLSIINPTYILTNLNEWVNVLVTYKKNNQTSSTTSLYINGELKQTDIHYMSMEYLPGHNFYIGRNHTPGIEFNGKLDDFRIYNRVLNENEILALYDDSTTYYPQLISEVYPLPNSNNCQYNESIKVYFSEPINEATLTYNSISTHGNLTGSYELIFSYQSSTNILEIQPTVPFKYGEQITVTLDSSIQSVSGINLSPFIFQFNVKPEKGSVKFAVADSFQLNFPPTNILSGDFNNDNKIDVIVSNYDSSKYTILLNNGSGGFTLGEEMAGVFKPYSISFTDIDNDRDLDMIVSTNEENKIRILRGTGQGIFSWVLPTIDANAPIATCPGDFDGDGDNDFVALCNTGNAIFYKNDGAGVFTPSGSTTINVPAGIRNIVGDIDNDGDLDIIGGTGDYWGVFKILKNDGSGNFSFVGGPYLGPHPDELAGGDFDGDYDLDFIKCDWYQNGVGIGLNNSLGVFDNFLNLGGTGTYPRNPVVNDFDADGDLDAAFRTMGSWPSLIPVITILKNDGSLNFTQDNTYPITGANGVTAADFDNNGSVDLVGISNTTNQVKFLKNCVDSLVAYYPFSNDTKDFSGNINDGINHNGVFSKDRYGNDNTSMFFNAVDSYVEGINPGNNLPIGNSPRSFSAWVRNNQYNQYGSNIFHYGTQQAAPTNFHFLITDVLGLGNGYGYGVVYGNTNLIDSTWHFVTGVYEGGTERTTKLYIDGKLDVTGAITNEPNTVLTNNWRIGRFMEGSSNFNGNIDELKVYNIPLTNQHVQDMYKATTTAPNLLSPGNDSTLINPISITLDWDSTVTANLYHLIIASDSLFNTVIKDTITNTSSVNLEYDFFIYYDNQYWKVRTINDGGTGPWAEINHFNFLFTDVEGETQLPTEFALLQNYPNPFNPTTTITYHLPKTANVELKVYDVLGNEVATLINEEKSAGVFEVQFNLTQDSRPAMSSGVYFYKLTAGDFVSTKKMILIK